MNRLDSVTPHVANLIVEAAAAMCTRTAYLEDLLDHDPKSLIEDIRFARDAIVQECLAYDQPPFEVLLPDRLSAPTPPFVDYCDHHRLTAAIKNGKSILYWLLPYSRHAPLTSLLSAHKDLLQAETVHPIFLLAWHGPGESRTSEVCLALRDADLMVWNFADEPLPQIINTVYNRIAERPALTEVFWGYMDDDAEVLITSGQCSQIERNITSLRSQPLLKIVSGFCVDTRSPQTYFHRWASVSNSMAFVPYVKPKPYCHGGGGGTCMRLVEFPELGLPPNGLGGISLNTLAIRNSASRQLESTAPQDWPVRTNPSVLFNHPTRPTLLEWSCTYLGYARAWRAAFGLLSKETATAYKAIKYRSKQTLLDSLRCAYEHKQITRQDAIGYLLIKWHYLPILRANTVVTYEDLAPYSTRAHHNLVSAYHP